MNKFLVIEGVDGAGKTSIAQGLVKSLGVRYVKTPGEDYEAIREYIDKLAPPTARFFYYVSSVFNASAQIGKALQTSKVVCDRYIWSSLIPHAAYFDKDLNDLERALDLFETDIVKPDKTVLLTVSEDEQLKRITSRNGSRPFNLSDRLCLSDELRRKVRLLYQEIARRDNWAVIDTTTKTVADVIREIENLF